MNTIKYLMNVVEILFYVGNKNISTRQYYINLKRGLSNFCEYDGLSFDEQDTYVNNITRLFPLIKNYATELINDGLIVIDENSNLITNESVEQIIKLISLRRDQLRAILTFYEGHALIDTLEEPMVSVIDYSKNIDDLLQNSKCKITVYDLKLFIIYLNFYFRNLFLDITQQITDKNIK